MVGNVGGDLKTAVIFPTHYFDFVKHRIQHCQVLLNKMIITKAFRLDCITPYHPPGATF